MKVISNIANQQQIALKWKNVIWVVKFLSQTWKCYGAISSLNYLSQQKKYITL